MNDLISATSKTLYSNLLTLILLLILLATSTCKRNQAEPEDESPPNFLFVISDDQSFVHTSFAGCRFIQTPAFDRVAREGVYFTNCYAGSPGCAPSRSALVTGRHHWQNEQSGQHASSWLNKHMPFVDLLESNGYFTGRTGKGVGPFQYARNDQDSLWRRANAGGRTRSNIHYEENSDERFADGISALNYFANFKYFMESRPEGQPFFFWYGAYEPHRVYEKGSWRRTGKTLESVEVPEFLPDHEEIRGDMLDYAIEIEWFDLHLQRMLNYLEETGELETTVVIVTADNGMPFPRAKANCFEYGVHVPLAIRYPRDFPGGRQVDDPVGFIDLAPTFLELSRTSPAGMLPITGKSILNLLTSEEQGRIDESRKAVFSGRERHSSSRYLNRGYPQRLIRNDDYILTWNIKPERWPAGAPQKYAPQDTSTLLPLYGLDEEGRYLPDAAFTDIDDCPSKTYIIEHHQEEAVRPYFELAHSKRPEFELYHVKKDPYCLDNLAERPAYSPIVDNLKEILMEELERTQDPRVVGPDPEVFDSYKRYSRMRQFPPPE